MPDCEAFVATLTALAVVDSINPTVTVAHLWVLLETGSRRVGWMFIAGVFVANFGAGVVVLAGVSTLPVPHGFGDALSWLISGGLIVAGAITWLAPPSPPLRSGRWSAFQAGGLAAGMTLLEFPTAAPYFSALALVGVKSFSIEQQCLSLCYYNILFVFPLVVICLVFGVYGVKREGINRFRLWLGTHGRKWLAVLLATFGACFIVRSLST